MFRLPALLAAWRGVESSKSSQKWTSAPHLRSFLQRLSSPKAAAMSSSCGGGGEVDLLSRFDDFLCFFLCLCLCDDFGSRLRERFLLLSPIPTSLSAFVHENLKIWLLPFQHLLWFDTTISGGIKIFFLLREV